MKAIYTEPYSQLSGKAGSLVNMSLDGNPVVRKLVTPANPQSATQTSIRAYFKAASEAFSLVTDGERVGWNTFAKLITRKNALGQSYTMSDKGLYVEVNCYRQMDGAAITDTAPAVTGSGTVTGITSLTVSGGNIALIFAHNAVAGFFLIEYTAALPGLQKKAQDGDYQLATLVITNSIVAESASPQTFTVATSALKNAIVATNRVGVSVTPLGAGYVAGTPFRAEVIVA